MTKAERASFALSKFSKSKCFSKKTKAIGDLGPLLIVRD